MNAWGMLLTVAVSLPTLPIFRLSESCYEEGEREREKERKIDRKREDTYTRSCMAQTGRSIQGYFLLGSIHML